METLVRTLTSHTQYIPDRLPRQASISCNHHGLIELTLGGTEAYLRDRNFCESRIVDRSHRIRTVSILGVLNLVEHFFGGFHIHFLLKNFPRTDIA